MMIYRIDLAGGGFTVSPLISCGHSCKPHFDSMQTESNDLGHFSDVADKQHINQVFIYLGRL